MMKKNERGFTLIELMVTIGVLSMLAVAYLRFQDVTEKRQRANEFRNEVSSLFVEIAQFLQMPENCFSSLSGAKITDSPTLPFLKNPSGKEKYSHQYKYGGNLFTISKIYLGEFDPINAEGNMGNLELNLIFTRKRKGLGPRDLKRSLSLFVMIGENKEIISCRRPEKEFFFTDLGKKLNKVIKAKEKKRILSEKLSQEDKKILKEKTKKEVNRISDFVQGKNVKVSEDEKKLIQEISKKIGFDEVLESLKRIEQNQQENEKLFKEIDSQK